MAITRSTPVALQGDYSSNGPFSLANITVPAGALCAVFCFSQIRSTGGAGDTLHNMTVSDTGGHTWTLRAVGSQSVSNAGVNAVWIYDWYNSTGSSVTFTTSSSSSDIPYNPRVSTVAQILMGVKDPSLYTPQVINRNTLASPQVTIQPSYSGSQIVAGFAFQNPTANITALAGSTIDTSPAASAMSASLLSGVVARSTPETSIATPVAIGGNATSDSGYTVVAVEYLDAGTVIVSASASAAQTTIPVTGSTTLTANTNSTGTGRTYTWSVISGGATLATTSGQSVSLTGGSSGAVTAQCLISDSVTNSTVSTTITVSENHYRLRTGGTWLNPTYNNLESGVWVSNIHYGISRGMEGVFSTDNRPYTSVVQADVPSVYYAMQEVGGSAAIDWSGNAQHGSYQGSIQLNWAMNPYQYAPVALGRQIEMVPYASNPYIQMPANAIDITNGFAFEAWIYASDYSWGWNNRLFSMSTSTSDQIFFGHDYQTASYSLSLDGGQTLLSVPAPNNDLNAWHHFAVSVPAGGGTGSVYIDGTLAGSGAIGALMPGNFTNISVGTNTGGDSTYSGLITQVAFYGAPLSATRVQAHYIAGNADADPVWYGPAEFYDPSYYNQFTNAGSVLGSGALVPVADFMPNGTSDEILADANYFNVAVTPNATDYSEWRDGGMYVIATNPSVTPADGAMVGTPGAETIGYFVSDESDMGGPDGYTYMTQCSPAIPSGYLQYANFGNFITMGMGSPDQTPGLFTNYAPLTLESCDIYFYAADLSGGTNLQESWGVTTDQVRRACNYGRVTQRARSFFDRVQPQLGFVELAHPYNSTDQKSGGPNPDQVEGAVWSHIIGGARGVIYFHHSFAAGDSNGNPITPPTWSNTASYGPGDCVNYTDPVSGVNTWYYAALQPSVGEAPYLESYTWVRWDSNSGAGISITSARHPDLPARLTKIMDDLQTMAPAIYSPTVPHLCHRNIFSTYRPNALDGKHYIIALPDIGAPNGGTFSMYVPAGQSPASIEVVGESRSITPSGGKFTDTFAAEYSYHIYRW